MKVSPIYIKFPGQFDDDDDEGEGHLCQFSEAIPTAQTEEEKVSPDFLRAASMMRYLPMAVSQFNSKNGQLMHQNPEACSVFGWPSSTTSNCSNHTCGHSSNCNNDTCTTTTTSTSNNNNNDTTITTTTMTNPSGGEEDIDDDDGPVSMDVDDDDDLSSRNSGGGGGGCTCTCDKGEDDGDKISSTLKSTATAATTSTSASSSSSSSSTSEDQPQQQQDPPMITDTANPATSSSMMRPSTSSNSLFSLCSNTMLDECTTCGGGGNPHDNNNKDTSSDEDRSSSQQQQVLHDAKNEDPSTNHFLSRFVDRKLAQKLLKKINSGQDVSVEALVHTKSGPEWNAIHARLAMDAVSEDPVILYTARDISEIIHAKKEMQVNLERAEFFAIMAHEIRTPLFQVTGFIDLLDETDLNKEQRDFIKSLRVAASSLMTVINDVLDYSKLEAGKMKLDIVPFEPKAVVDGSMAAIAPSAEDKGITLKTDFARVGVPVKLMGDPNRLRQVLLNLLQNAIKFTHTGSIEASVELVSTPTTKGSSSSCCDDEDSTQNQKQNQHSSQVMLRFSIKDTGIGISKEHMKNIFRKYTQAAASIATSYGGTGLGLSICKSLVECMGGTIGVDSLLGHGSVFWFQIPFDRVPEAPSSPSPKNDENVAANGMPGSCQNQTRQLKVLVAEDNGVSRKMISKMLKSLGHVTTIVENGEEAVNEVRLRDGQFDLILMDMQMPVMDGIDATKHIRSMGYTSIPIVGLTASVRRGDFQNLGLDDWIGKPVRLKELQKRLSSYFDDPTTAANDTVLLPAPGGVDDDPSSASATKERPGLSIDSMSISIRQRESLLEAPPPENTDATSTLFAENKMRNNMSIDIPTISLPKS